jgi:hypothetical protein
MDIDGGRGIRGPTFEQANHGDLAGSTFLTYRTFGPCQPASAVLHTSKAPATTAAIYAPHSSAWGLRRATKRGHPERQECSGLLEGWTRLAAHQVGQQEE